MNNDWKQHKNSTDNPSSYKDFCHAWCRQHDPPGKPEAAALGKVSYSTAPAGADGDRFFRDSLHNLLSGA